MRSFDLIAFDLDGTVYPSPMEQEPSPRVTRAFEAAHAAGVTIAVASGRPAWMIGRQLERAPWLDWRILANGSCVMPSRGGDAGLSLPLPAADAHALMDALAGLGGIFAIHTQAESFIDQRKAANYAEQQNEILDGSGQVGAGGRRLNPIDAAAALTMTMSLWALLLKHNPVSRVSVFGSMNPVFGVIISAIALGETNVVPVWQCVAALALVVAGIWVVNRQA